MCSREISEIVRLALRKLNVLDAEISLTGMGSKHDGFVSDLYFIEAYTRTDPLLKFHLVVKASLKSKILREQFKSKEMFQKEIFIYEHVKPAFEALRTQFGQTEWIEFMPKCFTTVDDDHFEALVLEDLKIQEFTLMDKRVPWSWEAIVLGLKAFGHWHALSFALKKNKPAQYHDLVKNNVNMLSLVIKLLKFDLAAYEVFAKVKKRMEAEYGDVTKVLSYNKSEFLYALSEMFYEDPDYSVILHGDCWSNNFLIKTGTGNVATEIRIIDWQCSGVGSPVIDLSHFIYACSNTEKHTNIDDCLLIYYESFSSTVSSLNCKPKETFSYEQLLEHWKRFSRFGLFMSAVIKKVCLAQSGQGLDYTNSAENGKDMSEMFNFPVEDDDVLYSQLKSNFLHYCKNIQ